MAQQEDLGSKPLLDNLKLLPLYTLALIKNVTFRGGTDVHPDERVQFMQYLTGMWVKEGNYFMYPRMFSLHDMESNAGLPWSGSEEEEDEEIYAGRNRIVLPKVVSLSVDNLSSDGVFLLDNSVEMYIWVGRSVEPAIMSSLFGIDSFDGVEVSSQVQLLENGNDLASRLNAIVRALRDEKNLVPRVIIVVEGDVVKEQRFFWHLVEDRASFHGGNYSYPEFMNLVNRVGASNQPPPPGQRAAPGMPPPPAQQQMRSSMPPGPPPPQQMHSSMPPPGAGIAQRSQSIATSYAPPPPPQQGPPPQAPRSFSGSMPSNAMHTPVQPPPRSNPQQPTHVPPPPPPGMMQQPPSYHQKPVHSSMPPPPPPQFSR